jgi:hypothetical protein
LATPAQRKREAIELPECKETAFIQSPKLSEKAALVERIQDLTGWQVGIRLLSECVVGESGEPVWLEESWDIFSGAESARFNDLVIQALDMYGLNGAEKNAQGEIQSSPSDSSSAEHSDVRSQNSTSE